MRKRKSESYSILFAVRTLLFLHRKSLFYLQDFTIAFDLLSIRGILQANRALLTSKMHGYEGTDVYEVIQNVCVLIAYNNVLI